MCGWMACKVRSIGKNLLFVFHFYFYFYVHILLCIQSGKPCDDELCECIMRAYLCIHVCDLAWDEYTQTHNTQTQWKRVEITFSAIMIDLVNRTCKCESIHFHEKKPCVLFNILYVSAKFHLRKKQKSTHMRYTLHSQCGWCYLSVFFVVFIEAF